MKNLKYNITPIILLLTMSLSAQDDKSLQSTIEKGKSDLVQVLTESGEQFNFGISADAVKRSKAATPIPHKEMSFEGLLKYEEQNVNNILSKTQKLVVPLLNDSRVVTTISVTETVQRSYKVAELINHQYHNELNQLPDEIKRRNFKGITIVYVPNLNETIYMEKDKTYTSYKGRSIRNGLPTEEIMKVLREDALIFQEKYGDQIKEGKLLN